MAVKLKHQIVDKTCEGCGETKTYDLLDPANIKELEKWHTHIREVWVGNGWAKLVASSCSPECHLPAIDTLVLPPEEDGPEIDLASLRTTSFEPIN